MKRIQAIDVFRAIIMFLMIFVNDVAGVARIPEWIKHTPADFDGMGFSDIIFPAFLFIIGLSLPFAIAARIKKGDSNWAIIGHILARALALIVMGFFHVNFENYNHETALIQYPLYKILLTLGFFLIWLDYPKTLSVRLRWMIQLGGVLLVGLMAFLYKGNNGGLQPHWWGILGIIGWAYLFSAPVYLLTKRKLTWVIIAFCVFALINITTHANLLHLNLGMIGDASSITLMLGGVITSLIYNRFRDNIKDQRLWILIVIGIACIVLGFLLRPYTGGISKIYATPAWVFICMGITLLGFVSTIYGVEVKGKKDIFNFIKAAGTSTLTCYLVPYLLYSALSLVNFNYPAPLTYGIGGILKSVFIAFLVIRIVAQMEKWGLRLKI